MLTHPERTILRDLALTYADIAAQPVQAARRARWYRLNGLRGERPLVLIDQVCWEQMDVDGLLSCQVADPYWRAVETRLRQAIYQAAHMPVDRVMEPYVTLPRPVRRTGWGITAAVETLRLEEDSEVASQRMHNQIRDFDDLERLRTPTVTLDTDREAAIREEAEALLSGILPWRLTGETLHLGLWDQISQWRGVTDCYLDLIDRPALLHALMARLTEGTLSVIDQMDGLGLFDVNSHLCHCSHTYLDGLPAEGSDPDHPVAKDAWAFGMAQLFASVAPEVTAEFEVRYVRRLFERFGAIYYGCCEQLDDRLDIIATLPNVRKLSCSPWNSKARFCERMPDGVIVSYKPNPAYLATDGFDEAVVRRDLRESMDTARANGRPCELILKDISTVRHDPARLWRWAEIAMEEAER